MVARHQDGVSCAPCVGRFRSRSCWPRAPVRRRRRRSLLLRSRNRRHPLRPSPRRRPPSRRMARPRAARCAGRPASARASSSAVGLPGAGPTGRAVSLGSAAMKPCRTAGATTSRSTRWPTAPVGRTNTAARVKRWATRSTTSRRRSRAARCASPTTTAAGATSVSGARAAPRIGRAYGAGVCVLGVGVERRATAPARARPSAPPRTAPDSRSRTPDTVPGTSPWSRRPIPSRPRPSPSCRLR